EMEGGQTRIVIEFFQWALFPAILFLMAAIVSGTRWRRSAGAAAGLAFCLISVQPARADLARDARKAFGEDRFDQARDSYRSLAESHGDSGKAARYRLGEG